MKRVRVICFVRIAIDPTYKVPWSDVWVRLKTRPGRSREYGVTLRARSNLEREAQTCSDTPEERAETERIRSGLESADFFVDSKPTPESPSIYTRADLIDRREAERMLEAYLTSLGYKRLKFSWDKPRVTVIPTH